MKRYNLSKLMRKAWAIYRKASKKAAASFSEALKAAWVWIRVQASNAVKVEAAAEALGVEEEYNTWAGWKALGRMVMHTEEATFKVTLSDPLTKNGSRIASYFLYSQTQPEPMA